MGCLLFYHREAAHGFMDHQVEFGRRLGTAVSLALENARLLEAGRESTRRAETLNAINEIIRSAMTPDELLERLVGEVSWVAGADKSLLIDVQGDEYVITQVRNVRDDLVGHPRPADYFPAFERAVHEGRPVLISDTWADQRTNKEFVVPFELRAFQLLPLIVSGSVVAVLALAYDEPASSTPPTRTSRRVYPRRCRSPWAM